MVDAIRASFRPATSIGAPKYAIVKLDERTDVGEMVSFLFSRGLSEISFVNDVYYGHKVGLPCFARERSAAGATPPVRARPAVPSASPFAPHFSAPPPTHNKPQVDKTPSLRQILTTPASVPSTRPVAAIVPAPSSEEVSPVSGEEEKDEAIETESKADPLDASGEGDLDEMDEQEVSIDQLNVPSSLVGLFSNVKSEECEEDCEGGVSGGGAGDENDMAGVLPQVVSSLLSGNFSDSPFHDDSSVGGSAGPTPAKQAKFDLPFTVGRRARSGGFSHEVHQCNLCGSKIRIDGSSIVERHVFTHCKDLGRYQCPHCNIRSPVRSWMERHMSSKHGSEEECMRMLDPQLVDQIMQMCGMCFPQLDQNSVRDALNARLYK